MTKLRTDLVRELGRILVSLCLITLAGLLFSWGIESPEPAQSMGFGALGGTIIGGVLTYWLKG